MKQRFGGYYIFLTVMVAAYAAYTFGIPPDQAALTRYGLTGTQARFLSLTILVPLVAIWYIAFYGFVKVKQYVSLIGDNKDGRALKILSDGLMYLAVSLPLTSLASNARLYISRHNPSLVEEMTIAYNYFTLTIVLLGIWLVAHGARKLAGTLEKKSFPLSQNVLVAVFTAFCIFYTYITLTDPARRVAADTGGTAAYYLPDFLVFSTIVIPYICLWYLGLRAAYHIALYRRNVPGILYQKALRFLSSGIVFVVLSLMVLRLTASLTSFLNDLTLKYLLGFLYFLLIFIAIGYVLVAMGAKKLKKIEEV